MNFGIERKNKKNMMQACGNGMEGKGKTCNAFELMLKPGIEWSNISNVSAPTSKLSVSLILCGTVMQR